MLVIDRRRREPGADHPGDLRRPQARGVDDDARQAIRLVARPDGPTSPCRPISIAVTRTPSGSGPPAPARRRRPHGWPMRIEMSVAGQPDGAFDPVGSRAGHAPQRLRRPEELRLEPVRPGPAQRPLELEPLSRR